MGDAPSEASTYLLLWVRHAIFELLQEPPERELNGTQALSDLVVEVPDVGHYVQEEAPERVATAVLGAETPADR